MRKWFQLCGGHCWLPSNISPISQKDHTLSFWISYPLWWLLPYVVLNRAVSSFPNCQCMQSNLVIKNVAAHKLNLFQPLHSLCRVRFKALTHRVVKWTAPVIVTSQGKQIYILKVKSLTQCVPRDHYVPTNFNFFNLCLSFNLLMLTSFLNLSLGAFTPASFRPVVPRTPLLVQLVWADVKHQWYSGAHEKQTKQAHPGICLCWESKRTSEPNAKKQTN